MHVPSSAAALVGGERFSAFAPATFPAPARLSLIPIYAKWADTYKKETGNGLNYQSIGSGGGIKQIKAKTVTFGATDTPLKPEDLDENGLVQWPMVMGGIVPVVNLDGVKPGELVLDGPTLAKIFLGEITSWNDPRSRSSTRRSSCPISPSPSCTVRTDRARPSTSPIICPRSSPDWKSKVGERHGGRMAGRHRRQGQRRRRQQRRAAPRARSAMSNTPTPSRTR